MTRPLRYDAPGCWHHVFLRGARKAPIFADDEDCLAFLSLLEDASGRYGIEVHAYSLMPNHYHLLLRSRHGLLSRGMAFLNGMFTKHMNARHDGWDGPVFRGRFSSKLVEHEPYLVELLAYIHLNPVSARLVKRPDDECWTSHRAYMGLMSCPPWLQVDALLALYGGRAVLDQRLQQIMLGAEAWPADRALDLAAFWAGKEPASPSESPWQAEDGQAGAEQVLARVSALTGVEAEALAEGVRGRRGNPARRFAIWALARGTTLTHKQIGALLGMTPAHVSQTLTGTRTSEPGPALAGWMAAWDAGEKLES